MGLLLSLTQLSVVFPSWSSHLHVELAAERRVSHTVLSRLQVPARLSLAAGTLSLRYRDACFHQPHLPAAWHANIRHSAEEEEGITIIIEPPPLFFDIYSLNPCLFCARLLTVHADSRVFGMHATICASSPCMFCVEGCQKGLCRYE